MRELTRWRTTSDPRVRWRLEFKLEDFWIGAFWHIDGHTAEMWMCFLPCLPFHLVVDLEANNAE